jgi:hypothetical protein
VTDLYYWYDSSASMGPKKEELMSGRITFGATLLAFVLMLAVGQGFAGGLSDAGAGEPAGVSESPGVTAPWFVDEVDTEGDTGEYASVAYDAFRGAIYVSYYDATSHSLRIARDDRATSNCGPGEKWYCHTLDTAGADVGRYSSIAVRPAGSGMGIAYHDATNGHLKYLWFDNPNLWTHHIATIDKGIPEFSITTGLYTSVKYSSGDVPFIAYHFQNPGNVDALMLAYPQPDEGNCGYGPYYLDDFQCDTIQTGEGIGQYASLALDRLDRPHIAYYDRGNGDLMYATSVIGTNCGPANTWSCHRISGSDPAEDVGRYASMYIDGDDRFHIAYYNADTEMLMYATQADSGGNCGVADWARCIEIDDMPADYHPLGISIDKDPAGYPVIAYQEEGGSLNLARPAAALGLSGGGGNCGPGNPFATWYCETIDPHGDYIFYRNGDSVSLDVSPSGLVNIAYNGFIINDSGNLRVAYQRYQVHLPLVLRNH